VEMSGVGRQKGLVATENDIDLDAVLVENPTQVADCERQYNRKLKELATFCGSDWSVEKGGLPPAELFTDERLAKYFSALLKEFGAVSSRRKTTLAAINDTLKKIGLPNVCDFPHSYPKLSVVLKQWSTDAKINPVSTKHAEANTEESLAAILQLPVRDTGDVINMAICCFLNFSGTRAEHAHAALSKDCTFSPANSNGKGSPRCFKVHLEYDKTLRAGSTTRVQNEALDKLIACTCVDQLTGKDLQSFRNAMKKHPLNHLCVSVMCPYFHLWKYFAMLPDPYGSLRASSIANNPDGGLEHLHLFRARASIADPLTGERRFVDCPLGNGSLTVIVLCFYVLFVGINMIRKALKDLNLRLPSNLQLKKPTGHTGRHSYASISMNAESGGDMLATSAGTGHRDPKSLQGYVKAGPILKMQAGRSIGKAIAGASSSSSSSQKKRKFEELEDEDDDYEQGEDGEEDEE